MNCQTFSQNPGAPEKIHYYYIWIIFMWLCVWVGGLVGRCVCVFVSCKDYGKGFTNHSPPPQLIFKWWSWGMHHFHSLGQGFVHSGSVSQDSGQVFLDEQQMSSFSWWLSTVCLDTLQSASLDFIGSGVYACSAVTCHLHFQDPPWVHVICCW